MQCGFCSFVCPLRPSVVLTD
ncbi:MAG: hypothetical protein ACLVJ6_13305 [Merdibacter sp.]